MTTDAFDVDMQLVSDVIKDQMFFINVLLDTILTVRIAVLCFP